MSTVRDDLVGQARDAAHRAGVPEDWGEVIEISVGDHFIGRHRGFGEGGRSGAWLYWDESGDERFLWNCYRLEQEYKREDPSLGDTIVVFRDENYHSQYDDDGDATGLSYGIAKELNEAPVPGADGPDEEEALF
jgi:hypothetical protein